MTAAMDTRPPAAAPIGVVMVAGTRTRQAALERLVAGPGFIVQGGARDAAEARALVARYGPSVVLLDLDLDAGGLELIEAMMAVRPTPIVVCGAAAERPEVALAAGAVDVVGALDAPAATPEYAAALVRHLQIASRVRVISHPRARLRRPSVVGQDGRRTQQVVVIGASTGGPPALAQVLGELPRAFEASVIVVQHMADGFVEGLARWLDESCRLPVVVAVDGERLRPGVIHIAPAGRNLTVLPVLAWPSPSRPTCSSTCPRSTSPSAASRRRSARRRSGCCSPGWAVTAPSGCVPCDRPVRSRSVRTRRRAWCGGCRPRLRSSTRSTSSSR